MPDSFELTREEAGSQEPVYTLSFFDVDKRKKNVRVRLEPRLRRGNHFLNVLACIDIERPRTWAQERDGKRYRLIYSSPHSALVNYHGNCYIMEEVQ